VSLPYTAVLIIPTGVGAAVGGYAGDALPVARAMATVADRLITHPNVLNGAQLYWPLANALYVEGYGLDRFAAGGWGLRPVHRNRVGLLLDQGIPHDLCIRHLQAADAARATLGLAMTDYVTTDVPLGVELRTAASGATWGTIQRPDSLLRAAETALAAGATALAVVANFPDDDPADVALQAYRHGEGVDPLAGAEAVISHLVVRQFQVPCAHAPALAPLPLDPTLAPKSAAEELGHTFLPCVLAGLSRAPQFLGAHQDIRPQSGDLWAEQVDVAVVPADAWGGSAVLSLARRGVPIIAVADNPTTLAVPPEALGLRAIHAASYAEAIGLMAAHKAGVSIEALGPTLAPLRPLAPPVRQPQQV